jgi:Cu/Ag efflux protein CusF
MMKSWLTLSSALVTASLLTTGLAFGQTKSDADCKKAPSKIEGQVTSVDQNTGRVTIREKSGTTHEFQANRETLQDMKTGDQIEAKLRQAPKC